MKSKAQYTHIIEHITFKQEKTKRLNPKTEVINQKVSENWWEENIEKQTNEN